MIYLHPKNLKRYLIATDSSRWGLRGLLFDNTGCVVSTDGFRMHIFDNVHELREDLWVAEDVLRSALRIGRGNIVTINADGTVSTDSVTISDKRESEVFPQWLRLWRDSEGNRDYRVVFHDDAKDVKKLIRALGGGSDGGIYLDGVKISKSNLMGTIRASGACGKDEMVIKVSGELEPAVVTCPDFNGLVMPMRQWS